MKIIVFHLYTKNTQIMRFTYYPESLIFGIFDDNVIIGPVSKI